MKKQIMGVDIPSFRKGDLVRPCVDKATGWRRATPAEREDWYRQLGEDCRAGRDVPYDSGGESKLAPTDTCFVIPREVVLTVIRASVSAPAGYGTSKWCCEVFNPTNGETLFVKRAVLTKEW